MPLYDSPDSIDEQVDPGLLGRLGRVGMSGISAVGNVLDLPGSAIRDVLAVRNPFDQFLPWNWTSSENRTSGRQLLRDYGLVSKEDTYGNWWSSFGAEIALDPLTYLGAGALLKGAQAGTVGSKGLFRASLPFSKAGVELGTGARAEQVAKGLGGFTDYLTKPSVLGPALEAGAGFFRGKGAVTPDDLTPPPAAGGGLGLGPAPGGPPPSPGNPLTGHPPGSQPRVPTPTMGGQAATPQQKGQSFWDTATGNARRLWLGENLDNASKLQWNDLTDSQRQAVLYNTGVLTPEQSANAQYLDDWLANTPPEHENYAQNLAEFKKLRGEEHIADATGSLPYLDLDNKETLASLSNMSKVSKEARGLDEHSGTRLWNPDLYGFKMKDSRVPFLDVTPNVIPKHLMFKVTNDADLGRVATVIANGFDAMAREAIERAGPGFKNVKFAGIGYHPGWHGVRTGYRNPGVTGEYDELVAGLGGQEGKVYINLFSMAKKAESAIAAGRYKPEEYGKAVANQMAGVLVHELAHQVSWTEGEGHAKAMTDLFGHILQSTHHITGNINKAIAATPDLRARIIDYGTQIDSHVLRQYPYNRVRYGGGTWPSLAGVQGAPGASAMATGSTGDVAAAAGDAAKQQSLAQSSIKSLASGDELAEQADDLDDILVDEGGTRIYKPRKDISKEQMLQTFSPLTLQAKRAELYDLLQQAGPNIEMDDLEQFVRIEKELARRAGGGTQTTLENILTANPGEIKMIEPAPTNIQDISSVVPGAKTPAQVAEWAKTASEVLTAPGRAAAMLFHAPVRGKFAEEEQRLAREQWERIGHNSREALTMTTGIVDDVKEIQSGLIETLGVDIVKLLPGDYQKNILNVDAAINKTIQRIVRHSIETGRDAEGVQQAIRFFDLDPGKLAPELTERMVGLGRKVKELNRHLYDNYRNMGGEGGLIENIDTEVMDLVDSGKLPAIDYLARVAAEHPDRLMDAIRGGLVRPGSSQHRYDFLRSVPSEVVERIGKYVLSARDGKVKEADAITGIVDKYGKFLNRELVDEVLEDGTTIKVPKWGTPEAHAKALYDWGKTADNYETYLNDVLRTQSQYNRSLFTSMANMGGIHQVLKQTMGRRPLEAALEEGVVPKGYKHLRGIWDATQPVMTDSDPLVMDAFREAGMNPERAMRWLAKDMGVPDDELEAAVAAMRDHMAIPPQVMQAIKGSRKVFQLEGWAKTIAEIVDIPTRWFKENVTLPFLSFATRNLGSGQYMIATSGLLENMGDLKAYGQEFAKAFEDYRAGRITKESQREWFTQGVLHEGTVFEGIQTRELSEFGSVAPDPISLSDAWREADAQMEPTFFDQVPGLRKVRQAHGTVLGMGSKANKAIEYLNRVPLYEYLKKKGWSAEDAARKVAELQIDYSKHSFSPFENEVMRRLVPFYAWQRKIAPVILGNLARSPAGPMAQTIRASRLATSDDPRTPEWLSSTLAIENPLGSGEPGGRSYITGFGLPYEPTLGFFGGGLRGAGREALSQLNPLIKAPLEWSTGQSFFQTGPSGAGRPLDELDPPIGRTISNVLGYEKPVDLPDALEFGVANSPLTRYVTTARQTTDPRKHPLSLALNLSTGARVTDVSPQAQDAILRHRASAVTKELGGRTFSQTYIPAGTSLSPAEQGLADQLAELKKLLDQRSRTRKNALLAESSAQ